jgi:hypothetical protein
MDQDQLVHYFVNAPIREARETLVMAAALLRVREELQNDGSAASPAKVPRKGSSRGKNTLLLRGERRAEYRRPLALTSSDGQRESSPPVWFRMAIS